MGYYIKTVHIRICDEVYYFHRSINAFRSLIIKMAFAKNISLLITKKLEKRLSQVHLISITILLEPSQCLL